MSDRTHTAPPATDHGVGGRYVIDPLTGARVRVPDDDAAPEQGAAAAPAVSAPNRPRR